jgi:hypothetical protein
MEPITPEQITCRLEEISGLSDQWGLNPRAFAVVVGLDFECSGARIRLPVRARGEMNEWNAGSIQRFRRDHDQDMV